jgi:hypothetical protein
MAIETSKWNKRRKGIKNDEKRISWL